MQRKFTSIHMLFTHLTYGQKSLLCGTSLGEEKIYIVNKRKSCLDPSLQNKSLSLGKAANSK